MQKLYDERSKRAAPDEQVLNSNLIDLFVKKGGRITEVYEVKTGIGRQMLYTAIGQLITHSAAGDDGGAAKFLIVPAGEDMPEDFERAFVALGIQLRKFRLVGSPSKREIELMKLPLHGARQRVADGSSRVVPRAAASGADATIA